MKWQDMKLLRSSLIIALLLLVAIVVYIVSKSTYNTFKSKFRTIRNTFGRTNCDVYKMACGYNGRIGVGVCNPDCLFN